MVSNKKPYDSNKESSLCFNRQQSVYFPLFIIKASLMVSLAEVSGNPIFLNS